MTTTATRPPVGATTGSDVQRMMSTLRARLVARYRLSAVPGRPEELTQKETGNTVSLGYGCKTIRIRKHDGREWVDTIDLQIRDGWHADVYHFLDNWFGYLVPKPPADRHFNIA